MEHRHTSIYCYSRSGSSDSVAFRQTRLMGIGLERYEVASSGCLRCSIQQFIRDPYIPCLPSEVRTVCWKTDVDIFTPEQDKCQLQTPIPCSPAAGSNRCLLLNFTPRELLQHLYCYNTLRLEPYRPQRAIAQTTVYQLPCFLILPHQSCPPPLRARPPPLLSLPEYDGYSDPLTVQSLPFLAKRPQIVPTKLVHDDALECVLPPSALPHASALPHNDLIGAMSGAHVYAVIRACFRANAGETEEGQIRSFVNEGFLAIR